MNKKMMFVFLFFTFILTLAYLKSEFVFVNFQSIFNKLNYSQNKITRLEDKIKIQSEFCFILDKYLANYTNIENQKTPNEPKDILDLLEKNKIGNLVIVTVTNYGFKELTLNWILSLKSIGIDKFVIFSFDQEFVEYLTKKGYKENVLIIPRHWFYRSVDKNPSSFLSNNYYAITQAKTNVVFKLLTLNQKFIFSDVDCVWLNKAVINYVDLIMKNSRAEMIYAQDFGPDGKNQPYYNTGFFYATPTIFTKKLYFMMNKMQENKNKSVDQFVFDEVLKKINFNDNRLATFDIMTIANGQYYFHKRMDKIFGFTPFVVHANYFASFQTKVDALKSRKHWFV